MLHKAALFLWEVYPHKLVSQSCPVVNIEEFWPAMGQSNLAYKWLATTKAFKFGFCTHTTALWPVEQSSILYAKFDCPVARQNFSLLATAHDRQTDLLLKRSIFAHHSLHRFLSSKVNWMNKMKRWVVLGSQRLYVSPQLYFLKFEFDVCDYSWFQRNVNNSNLGILL